MKNHLIIHGHFYQPPRENPWTGLIPRQESAAPHKNWNSRITKECYGPNAGSRFLHYDGRIMDMVNNYEYLSFNFGPTLLHWLKEYAPQIYSTIIKADKKSRNRNKGHGNAIAQTYNHTILPLDHPDDAETQIVWGLEDFSFHFAREAEGIWLPETAVNDQVIDLLIKYKVRFIILSPWQAEAIKADGSEHWEKFEKEPIPSIRPYRIDRPSGSIAAFFYNPLLAQGISFEHYLRSADSLYTRLLMLHSNTNPENLVHVATDGEVYGHHEPFGDMCLAALIKLMEGQKKYVFTNYGRYLDLYAPKYSVRLKKGEDEKGTSWSCFHGVSRWYKDCGCNTGGEKDWNQTWRTPLRQGFDYLRNSMADIYRQEIQLISALDPQEIRNQYINVITGRETKEAFAERVLIACQKSKGCDSSESFKQLFHLLEGQKYSMYMFTSCGWFFSELTGLEPEQNIKYAAKAAKLYERYTDDSLSDTAMDILEKAYSNVQADINGKTLFQAASSPFSPGWEAATYFFIQYLLQHTPKPGIHYGIYNLIDLEPQNQHPVESSSNLISDTGTYKTSGRITIHDTSLCNSFSFLFEARFNIDQGLTLSITDTTENNNEEYLEDLSQLPSDLRRKLSSFLTQFFDKKCRKFATSIYPDVQRVLNYHQSLDISPPETIKHISETAVSATLCKILSNPKKTLGKTELELLQNIFTFINSNNLTIEKEQVKDLIEQHISFQFNKLQRNIDHSTTRYIVKFYQAISAADIKTDNTETQNTVFKHIRTWRKKHHKKRTSQPGQQITPHSDSQSLDLLVDLCNILGIYADDLEKFTKNSKTQ